MNKFILMASVAIMSFGAASESWATCQNGTRGSDDASNSDYCGVNCCWVITTVTNNDKTEKVLTITPALDSNNKPYTNVVMKDFNATEPGTDTANGYTKEYSSDAPWARQGATSVVINDGITNIGQFAFRGDTKITGVTGMENVTSIADYAFQLASSLQSVDMPNVTSIGSYAFSDASKLQSVDMPNVTSIGQTAFYFASSLQSVDMPNVETIGYGAFYNSPLLTNIIITDDVNVNNWSDDPFGIAFTNNANSIITCLGDVNTCRNKLSEKYGSSIANKVQQATEAQCNNSVNYYYSNGCVKLPSTQSSCEGAEFYWVSNKCTKNAPESEPQGQQGSQVSEQATSAADCVASGKYWQEGKCVSSCGASFKLNDGWCDRQRYTPAEATAVLTNDNNNSVIITFKK